MSPRISITETHINIMVAAPYNSDFIANAKKLNGTYASRIWSFDIADAPKVKALCVRLFGTDGSHPPLTCTVRVYLSPKVNTVQGPIEIAGRVIAKATHARSGAKLGEDIKLIKGSFHSGELGTNSWVTKTGSDGATVLIKDFPRGTAEKMISEGKKWITIVADQPNISPKAAQEAAQAALPRPGRLELEQERSQLIARLAEIENQLKEVA